VSPDTLSGPELEYITTRVQNRILEVRIPIPQFLNSWIFFAKKSQVWLETHRIYEQCFGQFSVLIRFRIRIRNFESRILTTVGYRYWYVPVLVRTGTV
jgi:hypothetical protein